MAGRKPATLEQRFWEKVVRSNDGCWQWTGTKNKGYGLLRPGGLAEKIAASRISWEIHFGPIQEGLHVLHRCDNPECTNPDHLFLGTHADNMRDKEAKHRARPDGWLETVVSNNQRRRKVGPEMAAKIRFFHEQGASIHGLARMFQIDRNTVKRALKMPPV